MPKNNPYLVQIKKRIIFNSAYTTVLLIIAALIMVTIISIDNPQNLNLQILIFKSQFILILSVAILALIFWVIWSYLYLNSIKYSLDKKDLTFKGGVISRFEKTLPYSKVQHVIIYESLFQRMMGLSSVSIETAREGNSNSSSGVYYGYQRSNVRPTGPLIPDLNKKDAEKLKEEIIAVVNKYKPTAGI